MPWNIAQAKQQFSEMVRLSAEEPQAIYNRDTPVATLVNAKEYAAFQQWRASNEKPSLNAQFTELRAALEEVGFNELPIPPRHSVERRNTFIDALE
jgi:PHD/YefM family antitoxin component YafN of YafNO toxin-antitoxin module